jgi:DNA-binding LacI/PurR family transcriptional regulator
MDAEAAAEGTPAARRRPTMQDIATEAGVSKGLVSMVLSGSAGPSAATRQRVLSIAGRLGYRSNRTAALLARRRTRLLGVTLIPSSNYQGELVEEIQATAEASGYELVLSAVTGGHDEGRSIETLVDFRCEALLLIGATLPAARLAAIVDSVPTVVVGRPLDLPIDATAVDVPGAAVPALDVVRADDRQGIWDAVGHLVALGHRRIAHVDGGPGVIAELRRRAYHEAVRHRAIPAVVLAGGTTEQEGSDALEGLAADAGVTGIVAFNDRTAAGVIDRLERRAVRVPADMSVTGFDDSLLARHSRIDLTTVNPGQLEQARLAVELALQRLDAGRTARREVVLPTRVVVRGSTGPAAST